MNNDLFAVTPHTTGNGFAMRLKTGEIDVPDRQGGYIISSGCGSGKTESIKRLIALKANQGILYSVDTVAEVDKMYNWTIENNILSPDEVIKIHGGDTARESKEEYWKNPEIIMQKKLVLIPQIRCWTELINYFLIYRPVTTVQPFDGDFKALMGRSDLRAYILFDETPLFFKPFATITKTALGCFSEKVQGTWQCKSKADIKDTYERFIQGDKKNDFANNSHTLGRNKRDVVLNCIPLYWREWEESNQPEMSIHFYPKDLWQSVMNTHILIFEGAGDVLLSTSKCFKLLDIPKKYHAEVLLHPIEASQERRSNFNPALFSETLLRLVGILSTRPEGERTLIVVWKNIGRDCEDERSGESSWAKLIDTHLKEAGFFPELHYSITYYGSSQTKSTNEFRDYTGIILLGDWNIPYTFPDSVKKAFISETTIEDYRLWYYIQLLSRIGIRKSDGSTYHVWYTNDYKPEFIKLLSDYLNQNIYNPTASQSSPLNWLGKLVKSRNLKIRKEQIVDISALVTSYDASLKDYIMAGRKESFSIPKKLLYALCPKSEKKDRAYNSLKVALDKLGITLTITEDKAE